MRPPILVSRADRIGDLVLSLPALGVLRAHGFDSITLHCSSYAVAIGEWGRANGLLDRIMVDEEAVSLSGVTDVTENTVGLSLFHGKAVRQLFKKLHLAKSYGPRTKLSALWTYSRTLAQHRSRVEKSEMHYNIDLVDFLMKDLGLQPGRFQGLPSLKLPAEWKAPAQALGHVFVLSNRGSARNAPVSFYLELAEASLGRGESVELLVSGEDAELRFQSLKEKGWLGRARVRVWRDFAKLEELIAFLAGAQHVVSSSTGPLHIAHAAGVPVTGIYPKDHVTGFERWRPDGYWHKASVRLIEI